MCLAVLALLAFVCHAAIDASSVDDPAMSQAVSVDSGAFGDDTATIPDFDGDGTIGLGDFVIFAGAYGSHEGDEKYETTFDLNGDGEIGFADFLMFAEEFGKPVPLYTLSGIVKDGRRHGLNLPGATVVLRNDVHRFIATDNNGYFAFLNVRGSVRVTASYDLFLPGSVELVVDEDKTLDLLVNHSGKPPYQGTVWITPDVLNSSDPTSFQNIRYAGRDLRWFWTGKEWVEVNIFNFRAQFATRETEISVHPEYRNQTAALEVAEKYALIAGRLPSAFQSNINEIQLMRDIRSGANRSGQIHLDSAEWVIEDGWIEELLIHESTHASLDTLYAEDPLWFEAQRLDGVFISDYARDHPGREDVAESILVWFAVRYFPERLTEQDYRRFLHTMPNRLHYFDQQNMDMSPYVLP